MTDLLQRMLARTGKSLSDYRPSSQAGQLLRRVGVPFDEEMERILLLDYNDVEEEYIEALQRQLVESYRIPGGTQTPRDIQALALHFIFKLKGLLGALSVGSGKTLITYLAPLVLGAKRPLLLVPAHLRGKTKFDFNELSKHWQGHPNLKILSYHQISVIKGSERLEEINPDLIIADEAHKLKNLRASCTRKINAWMEHRPETTFIALSGTITKRSLMDYWHLAKWALGKANMPLPAYKEKAAVWAKALDEKVKPMSRFAPGALRQFVPGKPQNATLEEAREGYGDRFQSAPGVLVTHTSGCGVPIYLNSFVPELTDEIRRALTDLMHNDTLPNGDEAVEPVEKWRYVRELTLGFYNLWDPAAPEDWMKARKAWKGFARFVLEDESSNFHSEFEIAMAAKRGIIQDRGTWKAWEEIRSSFEPNPVPQWFDTTVIEQIANHVARVSAGGRETVVWTERVAIAEKLREMTGYAYFQNKGCDEKGRLIDEVNGKETVIASVGSNSEGHNLQGWSRSFITCPMPQGSVWEQILGRHDREGQEADDIQADVLLTLDLVPSMTQAIADAHYQRATTGAPQKLLYAQWADDYYRTQLYSQRP